MMDKIKRLIPFKLKLFIRFLQRCNSVMMGKITGRIRVYEGELLDSQMDEMIDIFLSNAQKQEKSYLRKLKNDIIYCYVLYGFTPRDYFLFNFHKENNRRAIRQTFISDVFKDYKLFSKEGADKYADLYDKFRFYQRSQKYFKRSVLLIDKNTKEEEFVSFAVKVKELFIKPNSDSYGRGAMSVDITSEEVARSVYSTIQSGLWIAEQRLKQRPEMARWNKSSVNTVRVNTYLTDRGFFVLAPFMRTGRKGSIVDNGGAGGVYATIDEKTGIIITDGYNELGDRFEVHPDSKVRYKGECIPEWNKLLVEAEKIHRECMADHIYISWDFAYTSNGWTVIEGNWGQFICQQSSTKKGFKKDFLQYMKGNYIKKIK